MTQIFFLFLMICLSSLPAAAGTDYNEQILQLVETAPRGGGYNASNATILQLQKSILFSDQKLSVNPADAHPSFCSGATYVVFAEFISQLQNKKKLHLPAEALAELQVQNHDEQPDGVGVWGRWNADGPGTARLFYELKLGPNFLDLAQAKPGDFLKIFWNDKIGKGERGHSVIFLGQKKINGDLSICYWSSNIPEGMSEKCVSKAKTTHLLFSRLEHPENLAEVTKRVGSKTSTYKDDYLTSLGRRSSTPEEMCQKVGCLILP
jgi:hypothetical protein